MAQDGRFPSFYVPDGDISYLPGDVVRVDHASRQARIVKDEHGDHEDIECRRASEMGDTPPMLLVNLLRVTR